MLGGRRNLQWLLFALQSLWEKPIREGVWPRLDPMESVCLRTSSMELKYGPHGEFFFFQIHKEPAFSPVDETFSPFINAGIRTSPPFLR